MSGSTVHVQRWTYIFLFAGTCALTWYFLQASFETVMDTFEDDSFYYLTIARRMALGQGSTFDGIHPTNGYHPLWCWWLVPVMRIFASAPETAVRAVGVICVWLRAGASVLLFQSMSKAFGVCQASALATLCFFAAGNAFGTNGMEEALQMLALMSFIRAFGGSLGDQRPRILHPVLLGLLTLSRLDSVFIAVAYFGWRGWGGFVGSDVKLRRSKLISAGFEASIFAGILGAYLLWNIACFDTMLPISGALKSSFPDIADSCRFWSTASMARRLLIVQAVIFTVFLVGGLTSHHVRRFAGWADLPQVRGIAFWAIGIMGFLAYNLLFGKWGNTFGWYYQPFAYLGAVALAQWLQLATSLLHGRYPGRRVLIGRASTSGLVLFLVMVLANVVYKHRPTPHTTDFHIASYRAARWVAQNLPPETILAMKDSGAFGFFSRRRVINLDGVVNNRRYQEILCTDGIQFYLLREGVEFYVAHSLRTASADVQDGEYQTYERRAHSSLLLGCSGGPVVLRRSDEVYRAPYNDGNRTDFVIWQLPPRGGVGRDTVAPSEQIVHASKAGPIPESPER